MKYHYGNIFLGAVALLSGWAMTDTGTWRGAPIYSFVPWVVMGCGVLFIVYGGWGIIKHRRNKQDQETRE